jgi:DNA invertase Pin-like site-specific DNA recombinase
MRIALYARVSTEDQAAEGYSLEAQLDMLRAYVENPEDDNETHTIYEEYVDEGHSGRKESRPAYAKMMSDIKHWDAIAVIKMDRIHRNSRNFMAMMDVLRKNNKEFISTTDMLDTKTATGTFVVDMIQRLAQLESDIIGERTYFGMEEKAKTSKGKIMGFTPPFGYGTHKGELVAREDELEVVRQIFKSYKNGQTMEEIAWSLNRNGILTRKQNPWNKFNLRNILHNPVYAGYMRWDGIYIQHNADPAVSEKEYNDVQILMASKVRDPEKRQALLIKDTQCFPTVV